MSQTDELLSCTKDLPSTTQCVTSTENVEVVTRRTKKLISYVKSLAKDFDDGMMSKTDFRNSLFLISTAWLSYRSGKTLHADVVDWQISSRISELLPSMFITIGDGHTSFDGKESLEITIPPCENVVYVHNKFTPPTPYIKVEIDVCVKGVHVPAAVVILHDVRETLIQTKERKRVLKEIFKKVTVTSSVVL